MSDVHPPHEGHPQTAPESPEPETPRHAADHRPAGRRVWGLRVSRLVYPALLLVVAIGLSAAGLSGSSIGYLTATQLHGRPDPALVAGTPRGIRSDEWNVAAPLIVAQSHHGYPRTTLDGV